MTPVEQEPPAGIKPLPPVGPEIRHLIVTTGDIDRLLGWWVRAAGFADADEALARYLREARMEAR